MLYCHTYVHMKYCSHFTYSYTIETYAQGAGHITPEVGALKYSQKWEMESRVRLTLGGVGKFILTTQTWASLPTDVVITTSAILKDKMKKETHGCEP